MTPKKRVTQRRRLYDLFKKRGWVTPLMAFHAKCGLRFSARLYELRKHGAEFLKVKAKDHFRYKMVRPVSQLELL